MDNHSLLIQQLQESMTERWPHDHLLFLWLAPVLAMLSVFLHLRMPWEHNIFLQTIATMSLLALPGALLLQWFAPQRKHIQEAFLSPQYKFWNGVSYLALFPAIGGILWGWTQSSPTYLSLSLFLLTLSRWLPQLQPRVILTSTHSWSLGIPIQAKALVDPKVQPTPIFGKPMRRGSWRWLLFLALWIGWSVGVTTWSGHRLPPLTSPKTLVLWLLGSLVCLQLSRTLPRWRPTQGITLLWSEATPSRHAFLWLSIPSCLLSLGLTCSSMYYQLAVVSPPLVSEQTLYFNLLLIASALTLLFDPSGAYAWIGRCQDSVWARRYGWIEKFDSLPQPLEKEQSA